MPCIATQHEYVLLGLCTERSLFSKNTFRDLKGLSLYLKFESLISPYIVGIFINFGVLI